MWGRVSARLGASAVSCGGLGASAVSWARGDDRSYYSVERTPLGEGTFGSVYRATVRATGEAVALKKIKVRSECDDGGAARELAALRRVRERGDHPNVAALYGSWTEGADADVHCLAVELVDGGELFEHLVSYGGFSEATAADLFRAVFSAIGWLHGNGVVHGDIKPENFVLKKKGGDARGEATKAVKLIDFGSALLDGARPAARDACHFGTTAYEPPEILSCSERGDGAAAAECWTSPAVDVWALGIVVFVALVGAHPFDLDGAIEADGDLARAILAACPDDGSPPACLTDARVVGFLSPAARDLLRAMLRRDPEERIALSAALAHPWFHGAAGKSELVESERRLAARRRVAQKFEAGVFASLVAQAVDGSAKSLGGGGSLDALVNMALRVTDAEDVPSAVRSAISTSDGGGGARAESTAEEATRDLLGVHDGARSVSALLTSLRARAKKDGDVLFVEGDDASSDDAEMYFIAGGAVDVDIGEQRVASLGAGAFVGEGALFDDGHRRSATVTCVGDTHLVAITAADLGRLSLDARGADNVLHAVARRRALEDAKATLSLASATRETAYAEGAVACAEGEAGGRVLFSVVGGTFDVYKDRGGGAREKVGSLGPGDFFGEASVLTNAPRNATVVCASKRCVVHEIKKRDFLAVLRRNKQTDHAVRGLLNERARS